MVALLAGLLVGCDKAEDKPAPAADADDQPAADVVEQPADTDDTPAVDGDDLPELPEIEAPVVEDDLAPEVDTPEASEVPDAPEAPEVDLPGPDAPVAETPVTGTDPDGADQLITDFQDAVRSRDADALAALFNVDSVAAPMLGASFGSAFAVMDFQDAVKDTFGEAGVETLFGPNADSGLEEILDVAPEDVVYEIDGDSGVVHVGEGNPTKVVRVDGEWKIDPEGGMQFPTDPAEIEMMMTMSQEMTALFEGLTTQTVAPGMTIDTLKTAMEDGMFEIMMKMMAQQGGGGMMPPQ